MRSLTLAAIACLAAATAHPQITYLSDARSTSGHAALDTNVFSGVVSISYSGDDSQSATPSAPFADFNASLLGGAQAQVNWGAYQRSYGAGFSAAQTSSLSPLQLSYSGSAFAGQDDPFSPGGLANSASQFSVSFSVSNSIPYALRCTPSGGSLGWSLSSSLQGVIISENYPPSQDYGEHSYTGTFLPDQTYTLQASILEVSGYTGFDAFGSLEVVCVVLVPEVGTLSATAVAAHSATLTGMVNPNGSSTTAWFQWGATTNYGNRTSVANLGSGTNGLPLSAPVAGLTPGVLYHFRVAATNDYGLVYGGDQSFTTESLEAQFTWTTDNGTITITGYTGPGHAVTIPSTINGLPVTSIGDQAFWECYGLTSVSIGSGVTSIGDSAFEHCSGLTSVTIPNSVTSIGDGAFSDCSSLTSITLPNSVTYIGEGTFGLCTSLTSVTMGNGVTNIGFYAFQNCSNLTSITLPDSLTSIEGGAFSRCSRLTSISIPNVTTIPFDAFDSCTSLSSVTTGSNVTSIGQNAFYCCSSLISVTIPAGVTTIEWNVFENCTSLASVTIPGGVTSIGDNAFNYCTNLTSITIPNSVTNIGQGAFDYCFSLTNITIPDSVSDIGYGAFYCCTSLTGITVDARNSWYSSLDGVLFNKSQTVLIQCPGGKGGNYTIPDSVTSIGDAAFLECTSLTNVTIPNSVTSIGSGAFGFCFGLASVTIPDSVTNIGGSAFSGCQGLVYVTMGNSVTNIGDWAFFECTSLTGVYFQGNAPSLGGSNVFFVDNNATVYYLPGTTGWGAIFGGLPTALWPPPTIQTPPQTQTAEAGSTVGLQVKPGGPFPLFCLWFFNDTSLISYSTSCELVLTNVQFAQSGAYTAVITNLAGAVTSAPAMLNVIAAVERRPVPGVEVTGQSGSLLSVDYGDSLSPAPNWTPLGSVSLAGTPQYCFDLTLPLPPQRFYRAWRTGTPGVMPSLDLHLVPAITLTGSIGHSVRLDYINQYGPTDAWVTLATVPLTNTSQLYFDTSAWRQPQRLYRLVPAP